MPAWFALFVAAVAALGGAIASVTSAGVGSLITPALSLEMDIRDAVVAVAAPHLVFNAMAASLITLAIRPYGAGHPPSAVSREAREARPALP